MKPVVNAINRAKIKAKVVRYRLHIFKFRILSLKSSLQFLFLFAITIIISSSLIPPHYRSVVYVDFFVRISYAYVTSLIFYFIVVHSPKEEKKQAVGVVINNRIHFLHLLIKDYYDFILKSSGLYGKDDLTEKELAEFTKHIELHSQITFKVCWHPHTFRNHFECFGFISKKAKENIKEILHYFDYLPADVLRTLNLLQEDFSRPPYDGTLLGNRYFSEISGSFLRIYRDTLSLYANSTAFKKTFTQEHQLKLKIRTLRKQLNSEQTNFKRL